MPTRVYRTIQFSKKFIVKEKKNWPRKRFELKGALAQLARAPALQAGCRGFEPLRLHQILTWGSGKKRTLTMGV